MDQFKVQLGLSPTLKLDVDLSSLKPLQAQLDQYQDILDQVQQIVSRVEKDYGQPEDVAKLRGRLKAELTTSRLVADTSFRKRIVDEWGSWEKLTKDQLDKRARVLNDRRDKLLSDKTDLEKEMTPYEKQNQPVPRALADKIQTLRRDLLQIEKEQAQGEFEKKLRDYEAQPWKASEIGRAHV